MKNGHFHAKSECGLNLMFAHELKQQQVQCCKTVYSQSTNQGKL